jgi:hypothetical protein
MLFLQNKKNKKRPGSPGEMSRSKKRKVSWCFSLGSTPLHSRTHPVGGLLIIPSSTNRNSKNVEQRMRNSTFKQLRLHFNAPVLKVPFTPDTNRDHGLDLDLDHQWLDPRLAVLQLQVREVKAEVLGSS